MVSSKQPQLHIIHVEIHSVRDLNYTLFGLLKSLSKDEKANWPAHLPSVVFVYNATPHSMTGFQPYELMFGQKAPAPCDAWLGLADYNDSKSTSKSVWG